MRVNLIFQSFFLSSSSNSHERSCLDYLLLSPENPNGKRLESRYISLRVRVYPSKLSIFYFDHFPAFFPTINPTEDINVPYISPTILISIRLRMNYDKGSDVRDAIFRWYREAKSELYLRVLSFQNRENTVLEWKSTKKKKEDEGGKKKKKEKRNRTDFVVKKDLKSTRNLEGELWLKNRPRLHFLYKNYRFTFLTTVQCEEFTRYQCNRYY